MDMNMSMCMVMDFRRVFEIFGIVCGVNVRMLV
jgi:hypothetical protein